MGQESVDLAATIHAKVYPFFSTLHPDTKMADICPKRHIGGPQTKRFLNFQGKFRTLYVFVG